MYLQIQGMGLITQEVLEEKRGDLEKGPKRSKRWHEQNRRGWSWHRGESASL